MFFTLFIKVRHNVRLYKSKNSVQLNTKLRKFYLKSFLSIKNYRLFFEYFQIFSKLALDLIYTIIYKEKIW